MISYLQGKIILKKERFVVLDVNGVGYRVFVGKQALSKIPGSGQNLKLFCYLHVRENSLDLYGFLDYPELEFFEVLNDIHGIGPKVAMEIASLGPLEKIREKILAHDEKVFAGIPGLGKKRTMAIIVALSGKIQEFAKRGRTDIAPESDEAEDALSNLGFPRQKVKEALKKISPDKTTEQKITEALKILGK